MRRASILTICSVFFVLQTSCVFWRQTSDTYSSKIELDIGVGFYNWQRSDSDGGFLFENVAVLAYDEQPNGGAVELHFVDVSNPTIAFALGRYMLPGEYELEGIRFLGTISGTKSDIFYEHLYLFIAADENGGRDLIVMDVSDPTSVEIVRTLTDTIVDQSFSVEDIEVDDGYLYRNNDTSIDIFDATAVAVTGSEVPIGTLIGSYTGDGYVDAQNDKYYVAYETTLHIIDIVDESNPTHVSSYDMSSSSITPTDSVVGRILGFYGDYVVLGFGSSDYHPLIIDVTDPSVPDTVAFYDYRSYALDGSFLLTRQSNYWIVFDVSDPSEPKKGSIILGIQYWASVVIPPYIFSMFETSLLITIIPQLYDLYE